MYRLLQNEVWWASSGRVVLEMSWKVEKEGAGKRPYYESELVSRCSLGTIKKLLKRGVSQCLLQHG